MGYDFDKTHIKKNWYSPESHVTVEKETHIIRNGLAELLMGNRPLPVISCAGSTDEAKEIAEMRRLLIDGLKRNEQVQAVVISKDSEGVTPPQKMLS